MTESRVIDLHGYSVREAMACFIEFYNNCVRDGYRGFIEVVHGYGSSVACGAIQRELRRCLEANADRLEVYIPGDGLGNPGMTKLIAKSLLPVIQNTGGHSTKAREAILGFCEVSRSKDRIISKLVGRFGDRVLRDEVAQLIKNGALRESDGKLERQ